jgi:hypothetical protein
MNTTQETRPENPKRINLDREQDVRYWTERFCCTEEELRQAILAAGVSVRSVQQLFSR